MNTTGKQVTMDEEEAEILNLFALVFTGNFFLTPLKWMGSKTGTEGGKSLPQ